MSHRAPSSSVTYKWPYDVFLSFYGDDTRLRFISHLYESLHRSGIHAFIDYKIRDGENITPALFSAIEKSRIAIIVFSENYANSTFCLQELEKIVDCFKEESRLIYPVFYYVDPSELRRPRGSYAEALARLEERFKDNRHKVEKWRQALSQVADRKGCHLKPKDANEQECISRITNEVTTRIKRKSLDIANFPVGLESRVKEVISFLDLQSTKETKMVGIWGAGGIGKSTIARAVYNSIADNFESSCFLSNVRKQSKESNGLSRLQETLLCELVMEEHCKLGDYRQGITIIEHRLSQKKTLLILDDVDELDQLQALARSCGRFGSRIIITTRNRQLLESHDVKSIYDVKGLNNEESLKLLCWNAFRKENMDSNYMEVCNRAIQLSCGFPIVLEVIGSNLCGKGVDLWSSALDQFKSEPHRIVFDTLQLSYDTLQDAEKQVFLDLACLFNGEKLTYVTDILRHVRAKDPKYAIEVLTDKSLVKFERDRVTMHDLIEDLGKEIVRRESNEPGKRSRLWLCNDILHVLQCDTGTDKVEAIILDLPESIEVQWSGEEFLKMENLRMLVIKQACFSKRLKDLPNSLRWLEWKGYPFKSLPHQKFLYLSHMSLRNCKFLQQIPDLSRASNLTELWLDGCTNLIKIHDSVGCLKKLRELSAMRCKNLKILPSRLKLTSLEHLKLFGCSSLQRFPEISVMMEEMQTLDLEKTAITELPYSICNLIGLKALNVDKCPNLKQLPACICTLPNLEEVSADLCEGMRHFKMCEGGDEASLYCSKSRMLKKSSKMEQLCFSSCNLSDDSLAFCLSHFTNMIHLDLSSNSFTILPECIKEYYNLKVLRLDNCNQLEHIEGMPPNLETFSAICCSSLTELSGSKVLKQAFNFQPGKRNFILPGKKFPERLHNYSRRSSVSFWVRNVFPTTFLWILVKDDHDYVYNCQVSVHINDTKLNITSKWIVQSTIKTDHIYICDMQSVILNTELPLRNKWNQVKVSLESKAQQKEDEKEVYFGIHLHNLQSHSENIRFMDPRRYSTDHILSRNIQEQDWEEPEEYMNLDSNPKHYQDQTQDREELEEYMNLDSNPKHYQDQTQDREELDEYMNLGSNPKHYQGSSSIMAHRAPSSSITYKWTYDVFLSFYGDDTRLGFTSHLHQDLRQRGIHVFFDDECIRTGKNITSTLFKAIEESRIAIIVFSGNYAKSTFCLRELEKILECFKEESRLIYPVFYHVDPSELRNPRESYAEALAQLENRFKGERHKVEKWRQALSQAADFKGCHLKPKIANEQECITRIANEVAIRINQEPLHVTNYPVGLVPRVKEVISYLDIWSTEKIKMIGIWGAGGIGKTTIARALYNSIADNFEGLCFLSNVRKRSKEPNGLSHLQETLLSKLVMAKDLNFGDYHEGIPIIQRRLSQKKILLILDDVDESDQLKALAGSCNLFGCGSRIIITTRDKQLLKNHGIESIFDVKGLNSEESLKLLSCYAFKKENVDSNYVEVCDRAVGYSCGFPLALEVIGSNLGDKGVNLWNSALQQFKSTPNERVLDALKLSYDILGKVEKQVFLDLACFFNGEKLANIIKILQCVRAIEPNYAIDTLIDKSLIKIEQARVTMHDLIEDVGKEIVQRESPNEPGERSRLWFYQDILHVLQQDTGTNKVEAIILDLPETIEVQWSGEELKEMKNLKMLVIRNACFSGSPKYLPSNLRWLKWKGYSFKFLPHQVSPTQLVYLNLSYSSCELLQPFDKKFPNLSCMNLRNCKFLQQIPDLSGASNLTELWLDGCTNLIEIHDSVGCLNKLRKLSARQCENLKIFPSHLRLAYLKYLNLFGCSSLQTFPEISIVKKEMQRLDLSYSSWELLQPFDKKFPNLSRMKLRNCRFLQQKSDLSGASNQTELWLDGFGTMWL